MEEIKKFNDNVKEVEDYDWLGRLCDTANVEHDMSFIRAFNRRVERFKKLFIEED